MTACARPLNPLRRDGTSRRARLLAALSPEYVGIDERRIGDLLLYARDYAGLLRYWTPGNVEGGDWVQFMEGDASIAVALIGRRDPEELRQQYKVRERAVLDAAAADLSTALAGLFVPVFELARELDRCLRGAVAGLSLDADLRRLVGSALADSLGAACACAQRAYELGVDVRIPDGREFRKEWNLPVALADDDFLSAGWPPGEVDLKAAVRRLGGLFGTFLEALSLLRQRAPVYLDETLERHPGHEPHMALFLAFLKLFGYAQKRLNAITAGHLDFYYREVLGLEAKPAQPDQVHVVFELAKNFDRHLMAQGTELAAGKDASGANLFYATSAELVVNRGRVDPAHGLKTIYVDMDPTTGLVRNVHAAPDADSSDGQGVPLAEADCKWPTFGGKTMPYATLGFAVASHMFHLAEGDRTITLTFRVRAVDDLDDLLCGEDCVQVARELRRNVRVQASGAKHWIDLKVKAVELVSDEDKPLPEVKFTLYLSAAEAAVVAYDDAALKAGFDTRLPLIRFLLDNEGLRWDDALDREIADVSLIADYSDRVPKYADRALVRHDRKLYRARFTIEQAGYRPPDHPQVWVALGRSYPYKYFQRMEPRGVVLQVNVDGIRSLVLENDAGVLNPAKAFYPFGVTPQKGSAFMIGSREIFGKRLTSLKATVTWAGLPGEDFSRYYDKYKKEPDFSGNGYFKVAIHLLAGGKWEALEDKDHEKKFEFALFEDEDKEKKAPKEERLLAPKIAAGVFDAAELPQFSRFDPSLRQGFMKLELKQDFLHGQYPGSLAAALTLPKKAVPNPPYTPLVAKLSLEYEAEQSVDLDAAAEADALQIFHIGPFGHTRVKVGADAGKVRSRLVPDLSVNAKRTDGSIRRRIAEGSLHIGLDGLVPAEGQNLSLLFQVAEGSEDPAGEVQPVTWSWLGEDGWHDFEAAELIADGTDGLLRSGVIQFALAKPMTAGHSMFPAGLHWIRAAVASDADAIPKLVAVHAQAVSASFIDRGNDPNHLAAPLPAQSIGRLKQREATIKSVVQPYDSFGGRMRESGADFNLRVSERLRHKRRAVSIFDYERLVLEQFPEIHKVKCLNHTSPCSEMSPGHVRMVVVPSLRNRNAVDPLRPALSLAKLESIRAYLADIASDFTTIHVTGPEYEEVKVRFNVRFHSGRDKGFYTARLNDDIVRFLSPWLDDEAADLPIGGWVHRSSILKFVEERDYVDMVADFRMDHIIGERVLADVEAAEATTSSSALVSVPQHEIGDAVVSCEDRTVPPVPDDAPDEVPPEPTPVGIKRYLGNSRERELHDLHNLCPRCRVEEIAIDRRYYFSDPVDALRMGYDYCAYCFGKGASKR